MWIEYMRVSMRGYVVVKTVGPNYAHYELADGFVQD